MILILQMVLGVVWPIMLEEKNFNTEAYCKNQKIFVHLIMKLEIEKVNPKMTQHSLTTQK